MFGAARRGTNHMRRLKSGAIYRYIEGNIVGAPRFSPYLFAPFVHFCGYSSILALTGRLFERITS
jgi:hypothetical protein